MAKETIFRVVKGRENPYAVTSKALLRDKRLSWDTRGLLTYLLSMPDDWEVRMSQLEREGPAKRTALRRMIKEAVQYGYMDRQRVNGGGHGLFKWITLVYEDPYDNPAYAGEPSAGFQPMDSEPSVGFPSMDNPSMDNPSMDDPSMDNMHIYRILNVQSTDDGQSTDGDGVLSEQNFDDDGASSYSEGVLPLKKKETARARVGGGSNMRAKTVLLAAWCGALIAQQLPEWQGGDRFADTLNDEQVAVLAAWLWAAKRTGKIGGWSAYLAGGDGGYAGPNPFEGVSNLVGKVVTQVRLCQGPPGLDGQEVAALADAVEGWGDGQTMLFGGA